MSDIQNKPTKEEILELIEMFSDDEKSKLLERLEKSDFTITPEIDSMIETAFDKLEAELNDEIKESEKIGEDLQNMKEDLSSYKENLKPIITEDLEVAKEKASDFESFVDTTIENAAKEQEGSDIAAVRASLAKKND
ncbi:MAG: hypothetical protein RBS56_00695 [Candidatus Gracilibacteria bacterium]|jgi:hypothetical protein|nr:hypothetical protein [Candidatus Gracilibacteria bacterium]